MNLWKKALPIALAACLLCGCGQGAVSSVVSGGESSTGSTPSTSAASTPQQKEEMVVVGSKEVGLDVETPPNIGTYGNSTVEGIGFSTTMFDNMNTVYYVRMDQVLQNAGGIGSVQGYDEMKFIVAVQGLVNRIRPILFVEQISTNSTSIIKDEANFEVDAFWFDWLKSENYMGNDQADYQEVYIESFEQFLEQEPLMAFIKQQGYVVWDPDVSATSNVVSTVCGIDGYLPVMNGGTVQAQVKALGAPEKMNLVGKFTAKGTIWQTSRQTTGSKKSDAYLWALEKYGDQVNSNKLGYLVDSYAMAPKADVAKELLINGYNYSANEVTSHDYFILNKCFVFDLSCFTDNIPLDDQGYGRTDMTTDYNTFKEILLKMYNRNGGGIGTVSGFTPWSIKYTNHTGEREEIGGLDGETTYVALCNAYNFVVDADAPGMGALPNGSFYSHVELAEAYENPPPAKIEYDSSKKYVFLYRGDYDGAAWTYRFVAKYYRATDKQYTGSSISNLRGTETVTWSFNPNLSQRIPQAYLYMMKYRTNKDYFICSNSCAGYVFPDMFREGNEARKAISGLPDGMEALQKWNEYWYGKFGLDATGFLLSHNVIINGQHITNEITPEVLKMFSSFSSGGILANRFPSGGLMMDGSGTLRRGQFNAEYMINSEASVPISILQADLSGGVSNVASDGNIILSKVESARKADAVLCFRTVLDSPTDINIIEKYVTQKNPDIVFVDAYNFFQIHQAAY